MKLRTRLVVLALMIVFLAAGAWIYLVPPALKHSLSTFDPPETLMSYLFPEDSDGPKTDAFLLWRAGNLMIEEYANGYSAETPHLLWSVSKSVTATLTGIAIHEGKLRRETKLKDVLSHPVLQTDSQKGDITIHDLMNMASGLDWRETYEHGQDRTMSSVGQMLYGQEAFENIVDYILSHPLAHRPGTHYRYSTGDTTLLLAAVMAAYKKDGVELPWRLLFDPLEMQDVTFEQDLSGNFIAGSSVYMRPLDLLNLGILHLNRGQWKGERLFSKEWTDYAWEVGQPYLESENKRHLSAPARQWWTNLEASGNGEADVPELPKDTVYGLGHWGQYLVIIPSLNVVAVRLGEDHFSEMEQNIFFDRLAKELNQ